VAKPLIKIPVKDDPLGPKSIDPELETVQGQLPKILDKGGPLMERAAAQGRSYANSRGLLNSSMAAEASQNAILDRALPIASQDAGTHARAGDMVRSHRMDLQLQDEGHQDILERIRVEHDNLLSRMDRDQRYKLESTLIGGSQRIQEMVIAEMGAINRTQGLTPEQQNKALIDVQRRAAAHMRFMEGLAESSPNWDPLFDDMPTFEIEVPAAVAAAAAPAAAPRNAGNWRAADIGGGRSSGGGAGASGGGGGAEG